MLTVLVEGLQRIREKVRQNVVDVILMANIREIEAFGIVNIMVSIVRNSMEVMPDMNFMDIITVTY